MNPDALLKGIWALYNGDTDLSGAVTGGLWRGTGKIPPGASMPYGAIDLAGFTRDDAFGSADSSQFQEGMIQLTFWSSDTDDTEINAIAGYADTLYDWCGTADQNTITVTGWTVTYFKPGQGRFSIDPREPGKYKYMKDYEVRLQKND